MSAIDRITVSQGQDFVVRTLLESGPPVVCNP